jgi:hypothetical protein
VNFALLVVVEREVPGVHGCAAARQGTATVFPRAQCHRPPALGPTLLPDATIVGWCRRRAPRTTSNLGSPARPALPDVGEPRQRAKPSIVGLVGREPALVRGWFTTWLDQDRSDGLTRPPRGRRRNPTRPTQRQSPTGRSDPLRTRSPPMRRTDATSAPWIGAAVRQIGAVGPPPTRHTAGSPRCVRWKRRVGTRSVAFVEVAVSDRGFASTPASRRACRRRNPNAPAHSLLGERQGELGIHPPEAR